MKRILAVVIVLIFFCFVFSGFYVHASESSGGGFRIDRESGGHRFKDGSISGGRPVDYPCDFKVVAQLHTDKVVMNYKYFFTYLEGDGHFNVRTVVIRNVDDTSISVTVYIFSDAPFRIEMKSVMYQTNASPTVQTFDMSVKNVDNDGFYSLMPFSFGGSKLTDYYVIGPNCLRFDNSTMSQSEIHEAMLDTLTLDRDDWDIGSDPYKDDDEKDENGEGGNGNGGGSGDGSGGGNDKPDFDLDFSNILTLIYSIIKALIDFIVSGLNMLLEFANILLEQVGQFSPLIGAIFTFLPEEFITFLLSGIVIMIILGIVKR